MTPILGWQLHVCIWGWQLFENDNYLRMTTIRGWQLFEDDNCSRMTTIWGWQLFEDDNYSRMTTVQGWQLLRVVTVQRWQHLLYLIISSHWTSSVSLSTFMFFSPLALLQLSLEVSNVAGVLLSQDLDLLPFILQSHRQLLHYVRTLGTYTEYICVHVYIYIYICVCVYMSVTVHMYVTVLCCNQRIIHCVFWSYHCVQSIVSLNLH